MSHRIFSLLTTATFALTPAVAWAQDGAASDKSYVMMYGLVILIVGLGMLLVLRPVGRATEVKRTKDEK